MEFVKQWALAVVIAAAAGAAVLILSPDDGAGRSVKTAVSIFLLAAMLSPLMKGISFEIPEIIPEEQIEQPELNDAVEEQMKTALATEITKILDENGIKAKEINIDMSISDNIVTVESVHIVSENEGDFSALRERISNETGAEVTIGVSG